MKCTPPDLQRELAAEAAPTILIGSLSNVTAQSALFTPERGEAFDLRLQRHSAGSFTAPLPVEGQSLILLAQQGNDGLTLHLNVCNNSIFKADEAALNILRQHKSN